MSAMSASSAAAAGLMPLSLIAEHKTSQPPPGVQSIPRSGSDKCVTASNMSKPTANGMEGPLPLVSQLTQSAVSSPAISELTTQHNATNPTSSSDVQLPASHAYQPPHQNVVKPSDSNPAQEGSVTAFTGSVGIAGVLSAERRHTEEPVLHQHQMTSTTVGSFSSIQVEQHTRSAIPAQLLQLQPSQTAVSTEVSSTPDTTSATAVGNTLSTATVTAPVPPVTTSATAVDDSARVQESSTTQDTTLESTTLHKQAVQQSALAESASPSQATSQHMAVATGQVPQEADPTATTNTNASPKSQLQATSSNSNVGNGTNSSNTPPTTQQVLPTTVAVTAATTSVSVEQPPAENTLKVATLPRQTSKRAVSKSTVAGTPVESSRKLALSDNLKEKESIATGDKPRRKRLPTQPYQSPIPELNIIAKFKKMREMSEKDKVDKIPANSSSEKLIVFYRNEFLAVRNAEGGFYVCQAMQNVYKSSSRIRIRWLSQQPDPSSDLYTPDFYDHTEFDCILTNLNLERIEKDKFRLPQSEHRRTESILQRALDVERGVPPPTDDTLTETHPDGLDLSLYRNEEQLKRRKKNKKSGKKKELNTTENKRIAAGATKRRAGSGGGSTISASAVAKAKKAAAIKRTAAVKRVVQQAAARRQASGSLVSGGSGKKTSVTSVTNKVNPANNSVKKDSKSHSSAMGKRKAVTASSQNISIVPEKRTRRGNPPSQQQQQSQLQSTGSSAVPAKTRGGATVAISSNASNKTLTSNSGGGGTNSSNGNSTTTGGTRRTLRNSK